MDAQFEKEYLEAIQTAEAAAHASMEAENVKKRLSYARYVVNYLSTHIHENPSIYSESLFRDEYCSPEVEAIAMVLAKRLGFDLLRKGSIYKLGLPGTLKASSFQENDRVLVSCDAPALAGKIGIYKGVKGDKAVVFFNDSNGSNYIALYHLTLVPER